MVAITTLLIVSGIIAALGVGGAGVAWFVGRSKGAAAATEAANASWIDMLSKVGLPLATGGFSGFLSLLTQYWWIIAILAVAGVMILRRRRRY